MNHPQEVAHFDKESLTRSPLTGVNGQAEAPPRAQAGPEARAPRDVCFSFLGTDGRAPHMVTHVRTYMRLSNKPYVMRPYVNG